MKHTFVTVRSGGANLITGGLLAALTLSVAARADSGDALIDKLVKKGVLTLDEAKDLKNEARQEAAAPAPAPESKWKINAGIKSVELFGDARLRYEYRGAETLGGDTLARERFRYALRLGIRGDLLDHFYYGMRVETSQNPRSAWVTLGDESNYPFPGPSSKSSDGINIGQVYLGWRTTDWLTLEVGKMPNPLYTTPMVWDSDINPEGASERFKYSSGKFDFFATFGQVPLPGYESGQPGARYFGRRAEQVRCLPPGLAVGGQVQLQQGHFGEACAHHLQLHGSRPEWRLQWEIRWPGDSHRGQPLRPDHCRLHQSIRHQRPCWCSRPLASSTSRLAGSTCESSATLRLTSMGAGAPTAAGFPQFNDQDKAYQVGLGVGNLGLVHGHTPKKGTWEARTYWQHVEQYCPGREPA